MSNETQSNQNLEDVLDLFPETCGDWFDSDKGTPDNRGYLDIAEHI